MIYEFFFGDQDVTKSTLGHDGLASIVVFLVAAIRFLIDQLNVFAVRCSAHFAGKVLTVVAKYLD